MRSGGRHFFIASGVPARGKPYGFTVRAYSPVLQNGRFCRVSVLHRAPVPHGPDMQPPRHVMRSANAPGGRALCARIDRKPGPIGPPGARIDPPNRPGHWSAWGQIYPRPLAPRTVQQTAPGIDPPGPQNRAKRSANRAACNGPGSARKPPNRGKPGKVCKRSLTCQTQKNPARGRDCLGLAG